MFLKQGAPGFLARAYGSLSRRPADLTGDFVDVRFDERRERAIGFC